MKCKLCNRTMRKRADLGGEKQILHMKCFDNISLVYYWLHNHDRTDDPAYKKFRALYLKQVRVMPPNVALTTQKSRKKR